MNNRKNYNSIVFLTVYLGLVLVGATPQVLAQAAMTRQFDIVTEIEFKDDLDKKPDDEQEITDYSFALRSLYPLAAEFIIKNEERINNNDYKFNCIVNSSIISTKTSERNKESGVFWNNVVSSEKKSNKSFSYTFETGKKSVSVILPTDNFFVKTKVFYNQQAEQYDYFYGSALSKLKLQQINNAKALLYQNPFLSFENNQFFTITRMPRASIDSLTARNA